jgi:hypothetical protein
MALSVKGFEMNLSPSDKAEDEKFDPPQTSITIKISEFEIVEDLEGETEHGDRVIIRAGSILKLSQEVFTS